MNLLPYQTEHADRIAEALRSRRVALDASDPGVGKTYIACAVAARMGWPVGIITTKATVPAWSQVAASFGLQPLFVANYESLRTGRHDVCSRVSVKRFAWNVPHDTLLIWDEVQKCKSRDSLNAAMLIAARVQHLRVLLCSATAASNPLEMRALGFALGLHELFNYYSWARNHGVVDGFFGLVYRGTSDDLRRIHDSIFPERGSRLRIADIPGFPASQVEATPVDTGNTRAIQRVYTRMAAELRRAKLAGDNTKLHELAADLQARSASALTIQLRARQEIELHKIDVMVSMAKDALEEGMSVVLLVNFAETIDKLARALGAPQSVIRGGQQPSERQAVIEAFQRNECPVVVANIQAGGVGVSLHDPSGLRPRLSLISPSFSAADIRQALGRVHRSGGASSVQKILFAAGTVEEHTAKICAAKLENIDLLNDGDLLPTNIE